jgi:hypothetical protein
MNEKCLKNQKKKIIKNEIKIKSVILRVIYSYL